MRKIKSGEKFCEAFMAAFPTVSSDFNKNIFGTKVWMKMIDGYPTTGEGAEINGMPIVDYYDGREPTYLFGVLSQVCDWAEARGWRAELQDPGTVKFYPN